MRKAEYEKNFKSAMIVTYSPPGEISKDGCWVCICEGYIYTAPSKKKLFKLMTEQWKHDRHLIG